VELAESLGQLRGDSAFGTSLSGEAKTSD
jgi:hypothetical protein